MTKYTTIIALTALFLLSCENNSKEHPATATSEAKGPQVPEGYAVEVVAGAELLDFPMFSTLDETGRLFVFESIGNVYANTQEAIDTPQFRIKLLIDTSGDGRYDKMTVFADSIGFPQGGVFYNGSLYASSAPDLLKLTDVNNDGVADKREVILSGWKLNINANSLIGPVMGPDGWLYMNNAIEGFDVTSKEGKRLKGETARLWRLKPDGSSLEWVSAGGMNNPVEVTFTDAGEPIGTETYFTDPQGGERDALVYWIEGGVYPKPNENITRDQLVRTGDLMPVVTKYSRVAPSGICSYRSAVFGSDFKTNLFSAQFNTHRIIRHKLVRQGASFRTEDEIFFWNHDEDFHPTDVLEDADGSLLIVETGGWFIKGCPLSQVSKPELKGAIYRVRKIGGDKIQDPYGNDIRWDALSARDMVKYLEDARPFVADRAIKKLSEMKGDAIDELASTLKQSTSIDARTRAVFALYRSGAEHAAAALREALNDKETQVSVAAARAVGLAKDKESIPVLINLLAADKSAAVRRQAATAIGQIGGSTGVSALLNSTSGDTDRFINHAIIYSLILINEVAATRTGLTHASAQVREAALIALDQMSNSALTFNELTPFLTAVDQKLQRRALWVAVHHPEWAKEITHFISQRFNDSLTAGEEQLLADILVSFSSNSVVQQFVAKEINAGNKRHRLLLLDVIGKTQMKALPITWIKALSTQLDYNADADSKSKAVEIVQLRGLRNLENALAGIASDPNNSAALRMQAITAMQNKTRTLSEKHFAFLYKHLSEVNEASIQQQAASALEQSILDEKQLTKLATEFLPRAAPHIFPRLLPLFEGVHSAKIGKALASTLHNSAVLDGFSEEVITDLFKKYPKETKPAVDSLMTKLKNVRASRLQRLQEYESALDEGVIDRGRALFFGKATCGTCHTIGSSGGNMGPDLTSIQRDRSMHDLLEAIVYPSASFVREFETFKIKTHNGEHTGIIKSKSPEAIVLTTAPQTSVRINRSEIETTEVQQVSMMPQGLDKLLTKQEMADLMVFLVGQDQDPETDARILRHTSSNKN